MWNNVFPWSTLEVQKEDVWRYVNISFTLFIRLREIYIYIYIYIYDYKYLYI